MDRIYYLKSFLIAFSPEFVALTVIAAFFQMPQIQKRFLNVHEYLSQELMSKFGIRVPRGSVARTADEAQRVAERLGSFAAQISRFAAPQRAPISLRAAP